MWSRYVILIRNRRGYAYIQLRTAMRAWGKRLQIEYLKWNSSPASSHRSIEFHHSIENHNSLYSNWSNSQLYSVFKRSGEQWTRLLWLWQLRFLNCVTFLLTSGQLSVIITKIHEKHAVWSAQRNPVIHWTQARIFLTWHHVTWACTYYSAPHLSSG